MSTYNGETYLRGQLDSLISQDYINLSVLVRDDGSSDRTCEILREYEAKMNLKWYSGQNIGLAASFFDLVKNANDNVDYYAFCDQDDVWLPNKVSVAVSSIKSWENSELPCAYGCRSTIVDKDLITSTLNKVMKRELTPTFGNAIAQCILQGCSTMINSAMRRELIANMPIHAITHDWWIYLVATAIGMVYIDPTSYLLYRQHQGNVMGRRTMRNAFHKYVRIYQLWGKTHSLLRQVEEFNEYYAGRLNDQQIRLLNCFLKYRDNICQRFSLVFNLKIKRLRPTDDILWRAVCLFDLL